jgi:hypothetical protein
VPFLGAGANMCDRPDDTPWESGQFLPSGAELAASLAEQSRYPAKDSWDLLRVSQYVDAVLGEGQLYRYLRKIFDVDYPTTSLHAFLARLPEVARQNEAPQPLVITTNYDDLVERALRERGEAFDVVWYEAKGSLGGKFIHRPPGEPPVPIDVPDKYDGGLSHAKLRVILNRIWGAQELDLKSWAIQREPEDPTTKKIEEKLWSARGDVELLYAELRDYVARLSEDLFGAAAEPAA